MADPSTLQQTILAASNTAQHALSLTRKAKLLTEFLFDGADLPDVLTSTAKLLAIMTSSAAVASGLYYVFQQYCQDRAKTQLAIFHVIRMLEHLPSLEFLLDDPQLLIEDINAEVMRTMSQHLSTRQITTVKKELKRKIWECVDEHHQLVTAMKRKRTGTSSANMTEAQIKYRLQKAASKRGPGYWLGYESSTSSPLGRSEIKEMLLMEDSNVEEPPQDPDVDMLNEQQPATTRQPTPRPPYIVQDYVTPSQEEIGRSFQNAAPPVIFRPRSNQKPSFGPSSGNVNHSPFSDRERGYMSKLDTNRGRTNLPLFTRYPSSNKEPDSVDEVQPSTDRGNYEAPAVESESDSGEEYAPPTNRRTYRAATVESDSEEEPSPPVRPADSEEPSSPPPGSRKRMDGYGLDYSDEELYTSESSPSHSPKVSRTAHAQSPPKVSPTTPLQPPPKEKPRSRDPPYRPDFDRESAVGILGKQPVSKPASKVAGRMPPNTMAFMTQNVNYGTWLEPLEEGDSPHASPPQGTSQYRVAESRKLYKDIQDGRERRRQLFMGLRNTAAPDVPSPVTFTSDWPSPIMVNSSDEERGQDDESNVDGDYMPSPGFMDSPPSVREISPALPSPEMRDHPPSEYDFPPSEDDFPPSEDDFPPSMNKFLPIKGYYYDASPVEEEVPPAPHIRSPRPVSSPIPTAVPTPSIKRGRGRPRKAEVEPVTPKQPAKRGLPPKDAVRVDTPRPQTPGRRSSRAKTFTGNYRGM